MYLVNLNAMLLLLLLLFYTLQSLLLSFTDHYKNRKISSFLSFFFMYHNKKTITLWFKWSDYFFFSPSMYFTLIFSCYVSIYIYIYVSFFIYIIPIPYILAVCISHIPFVFRSVLKVASVGEYVVHGGFFFLFVYRTYICILYNCNFFVRFSTWMFAVVNINGISSTSSSSSSTNRN